jgi:ankyrin repeat protein
MSKAYQQLDERKLPQGNDPITERVDAHFTSCNLGTLDCHGMIRHVLDCLGSLRVRAKLDNKMNTATRKLFRDACNKFLDAIVDGHDETYEDGSAVHNLLNVFPDDQKRRDGRGWLPLHWAACTDDYDEEDMKVIARERPIMAKSGHGPNQGSTLDMTSSGLLPFHFICSLKHCRLANVKWFLSMYPAAIKTPDPQGWLSMHWASWNCMDQDVIRFLIDAHNPSVYEQTKKGQLPFLLALHNRRVDTLNELLNENADALDACDYKGNTAVHYASEHANPDGAKLVLKLNPDLALVKNFHDELPVHYAFGWVKRDDKRGRWRQLETMRIILDANPETCSLPDKDGNLPLHLAVAYNASYEIIEAVYSVYPSAALIPDGDGNLPASYCDKDNLEVQNLLFSSSKPLKKLGLTSSFAKSIGIAAEMNEGPFDPRK